MTIKVYNTRTKQKEIFVPLNEGKAGIYVCGPTTYNYIHLGNARPLVAFDVIRRYLGYRGYAVTYVQNFTDVDDKIINRAQEEGMETQALADKYIDAYFEDADALGVQRADVHPRVTTHMPQIIEMVQTIIENGLAYVVGGDVYYEVRKFARYGSLSGRDLDDLRSGARVAIGEQKRDPLDFALWKAAKPGEPAWDSPWGPGRPGWHIECSVMSAHYLGPTFDIHGGGADLIFPHHENEAAQSEGCFGVQSVRFWLHNGFITINQEKMSKSLGNFFLVRDILTKFPGPVVRFYLLSTHYRSPLDFDDTKLTAAARSLSRITNTYQLLAEKVAHLRKAPTDRDDYATQLATLIAPYRQKIIEAMDDDFNTALALAAIFELCREINALLNDRAFNGGEKTAAALVDLQDFFAELDTVFGVIVPPAMASDDLSEDLLRIMLAIRDRARQAKDWATADFIRDELKGIGITIEDTADGPRWKKS